LNQYRPNISLTYSLAFIKIKIAPIKINLEKILFEDISKEKIRSNIIATNTCTSISDRKDLNQELNNIAVFLLHKERMAKGESKTNILIKTYLTAYVMTKFSIPIETRDFIIPSNEKISKFSLIDITEFNLDIILEKQILVLNRFSPICLTAADIVEIK